MKRIGLTMFPAAAMAVLLTSCGGGKPAQETPREGPSTQPPPTAQTGTKQPKGSKDYPLDKGIVTLAGVVKLDAEKAPKRKPVIGLEADPKCAEMHKGTALLEEVEVVDEATMGIRGCIVYVGKGLGEYRFEPPDKPFVVDQKACRYVPHVFTVMVDQPVHFLNSDPTAHNVHVLPDLYNRNQPKQGQVDEFKFLDPGVPIGIKCDIHPWMNSQAGVFEHPFHAVTNEKGEFKIEPKLIPGKYTLTVFHLKYGEQQQEFEVAEGESGEKRFDELKLKR